MGLSDLKLRTIAIFLVISLIIVLFVFKVPSESKQMLIAPNSPLYFINLAGDFFRDFEELNERKCGYLIDMAQIEDYNKVNSVFQEYVRYNDFYFEKEIDYEEDYAVAIQYIVKHISKLAHAKNTESSDIIDVLDLAIIMNLEKRQFLIEEIKEFDSQKATRIDDSSVESIMEEISEQEREFIWSEILRLRNNS